MARIDQFKIKKAKLKKGGLNHEIHQTHEKNPIQSKRKKGRFKRGGEGGKPQRHRDTEDENKAEIGKAEN